MTNFANQLLQNVADAQLSTDKINIRTEVENASKQLADAIGTLNFFAGASFIVYHADRKILSCLIDPHTFKALFPEHRTLDYDHTQNELVAELNGIRYYTFVEKEGQVREAS